MITTSTELNYMPYKLHYPDGQFILRLSPKNGDYRGIPTSK